MPVPFCWIRSFTFKTRLASIVVDKQARLHTCTVHAACREAEAVRDKRKRKMHAILKANIWPESNSCIICKDCHANIKYVTQLI